jgi:hypothetical protein
MINGSIRSEWHYAECGNAVFYHSEWCHAECRNAELKYPECHNAECCHSEWYYSECCNQTFVILGILMLSVVILSAVESASLLTSRLCLMSLVLGLYVYMSMVSANHAHEALETYLFVG